MSSKTVVIEYITIKKKVITKTFSPKNEVPKTYISTEMEDPKVSSPKPYRVEAESPRDKVSDGHSPLSPTGPSYRSPLNPGPRMPKNSPQSGLPVPRSGVLSDRTVRLPGLIPRNGFKN